jgi:hypothetical protein
LKACGLVTGAAAKRNRLLREMAGLCSLHVPDYVAVHEGA